MLFNGKGIFNKQQTLNFADIYDDALYSKIYLYIYDLLNDILTYFFELSNYLSNNLFVTEL